MFILYTWEAEDLSEQGVGVAVRVDTTWYVVPYEIGIAEDLEAWMVANEAQILLDAPTLGDELDPVGIIRELLDEDRGANAREMLHDVDDVVDLFRQFSRRKVFKALVLLILDEINILREREGLTPRTPSQIRAALRNKLDETS